MEPITFLLWMWLTWGTVRMFGAARTSSTPAKDTKATAARPARTSATIGATPDAATPRRGWVRRADEAAASTARTTDWGNAGWWLRAALAAAWTPVADLRKARKWGWDKYQDRKERRRQGDEPEVDQPKADEPKADEPEINEPKTDERHDDQPEIDAPKADEPDLKDEPEVDERQGDEPKAGERQDDEPWWRPYQRQADDGGDYQVEVEVVRPRTFGEAPALERPRPSLTVGVGAGTDAGERPFQTPPGPSGPVVQVVDAVRVGELEEGADMSKYVAIPGASSAPTTSVETGGNTHDDAVHLAKQIVKAVKMTTDPATEAEAMIRASLRAAWAAVDQLAAAGISGQVVDKWANTVIAFDAAHKTAARLAVELNAAHDAAVDAERLQRRLGDRIQAAVEAAGKSAANSTRYYGKS